MQRMCVKSFSGKTTMAFSKCCFLSDLVRSWQNEKPYSGSIAEWTWSQWLVVFRSCSISCMYKHTLTSGIFRVCGFGQQSSWRMWSGVEKEWGVKGCNIEWRPLRCHFLWTSCLDYYWFSRGSVDMLQRKSYMSLKMENILHKTRMDNHEDIFPSAKHNEQLTLGKE